MDKEALEKLSQEIGIRIKDLNYLNKDKWYHGTTLTDCESIKQQGVISSYNIGTELDFGPGFYLTDSIDNASRYMERLPEVLLDGTIKKRESWCVIEFEFNPFKILFECDNGYKYKCFGNYDEEFAEFIFENRLNNVYNESPHNLDIIWGVMSDSLPAKIVIDYKNNNISKSNAINMLMKGTSMKQLYIGNQDICNQLAITNIIIFEGGEKHDKTE